MEIILIRHGKPTAAINPRLTAAGFINWVRHYNASNVSVNSRPENIVEKYKSYYVISSDLKRAIHSAQIYTGKMPEESLKLFREMEIPRYKLPFRLKAWTWVYLCRVFWTVGLKGSFESYKEAKDRAKLAAETLTALAKEKDKVVLFCHAYMNFHIRKSLIKSGWLLNTKNNNYWGVTSLEI